MLKNHKENCLSINGAQSVKLEKGIIEFKNYCKKTIGHGDENVRDHCHVTGKFRGAAHWSCNISLQLNEKFPVIFHNLRGYYSHLSFNKLSKFDVKIDVIPNGLEKYMAFF